MKQRKPPYVLGGILVVALCIVVAIGFSFAKQETGESGQQQPTPDVETSAPREAPSPEIVSSAVKKTSGKGAAPAPKAPTGMDGKAAPGSSRPSVMLPKRDRSKPKPDPTATGSQWW